MKKGYISSSQYLKPSIYPEKSYLGKESIRVVVVQLKTSLEGLMLVRFGKVFTLL